MRIGGVIVAAAALAALVGCASGHSPSAGAVPAESAPEANAEAGSNPAKTMASPESVVPSGHYAFTVESQPSGATVVVDGIPVGQSPRRVVVPGTSHGFFRTPISIKVRFVAADEAGVSQTVEESLTPYDRIPASLIFTPAGAQRRLR